MPTHVVAWSGGPDSTYGLLQFLRDTDDPVVAVCVGAAVDPNYVRAFMRATRRLEGPIRERTRDFHVVRYSMYAENTVAEPSDEVTVLAMVTALKYDDAILYWFCCAEDEQPNAWPVRIPLPTGLICCGVYMADPSYPSERRHNRPGATSTKWLAGEEIRERQ